MRCCVYTRFVYEIPYLDSFLEHYLNLGFDKIFILYHDIVDYDLPEYLIEYVEIITVENNGNKLLNEYKYLFEKDYDWVLNVDSDEFLVLHKKYGSIQDYIEEKVNMVDENINMFQFSWAWIHAFNPPTTYTLEDIFHKYKIFAGSREVNSTEIWVKSMCRIKNIQYLTCHNCILNTSPVIYVNGQIENGEHHTDSDDDIDFNDKTDIGPNTDDTSDTNDNSINLLPRYYQYDETIYSEAMLIHVNTRNIMSAIIKGLNIHSTQVKSKRIYRFKQLKNFVNNFQVSNEINDSIIRDFANCVGYKINFPLQCLKNILLNNNIEHIRLCPMRPKNTFCNVSYIPEQNRYHLDIFENKMLSLYYTIDLNKFLKLLSFMGFILDKNFKMYSFD